MTEPDLFAAAEARDQALAKVADNNKPWMRRAIDLIRTIGAGTILTGEAIRIRCEFADIKPGHPNAWGALTRAALRQNLIEPTGNYVPMQAEKSHARITPEYRRKNHAG